MHATPHLSNDRVRRNTADEINREIDLKTNENIRRYSGTDSGTIRARMAELNKEWDIERALEFTSALNVLIGFTLGLTVNKRWFLLSAASSAFLVQHALQGWCPPLPIFRRFGIRTKDEINKEKIALGEHLENLKQEF
jgi:hypothetical protein